MGGVINGSKMDEISLISDRDSNICYICGKEFGYKISQYKTNTPEGEDIYFCSISCKTKYLEKNKKLESCVFCKKQFAPIYNYQRLNINDKTYYVCSSDCERGFIAEIKKNNNLDELNNVTRKIVIHTQKGGTAKTTTALNLSVALSFRGYRVLLVDGDPQGNIAISLGIDDEKLGSNLYHLLLGKKPIKEVIYKDYTFQKDEQENKNLDLLLSNQSLSAINVSLVKEDVKSRYKIFSNELKKIEREYDFIIIDTSPAISLLNQNLIYAADEIIIPAACDYLSYATIDKVLEEIKALKKHFNYDIELLGVLPTFYISNQKVSQDILGKLRKKKGIKNVFSPIRDRADVKIASNDKVAVVLNTKSEAYSDYLELADVVSKKKIKKDKDL